MLFILLQFFLANQDTFFLILGLFLSPVKQVTNSTTGMVSNLQNILGSVNILLIHSLLKR